MADPEPGLTPEQREGLNRGVLIPGPAKPRTVRELTDDLIEIHARDLGLNGGCTKDWRECSNCYLAQAIGLLEGWMN